MSETPFATDFTNNEIQSRPVLKGQFAPKPAGTPFAVSDSGVSYETATHQAQAYDPTGTVAFPINTVARDS